jgi:hypothetical protein
VKATLFTLPLLVPASVPGYGVVAVGAAKVPVNAWSSEAAKSRLMSAKPDSVAAFEFALKGAVLSFSLKAVTCVALYKNTRNSKPLSRMAKTCNGVGTSCNLFLKLARTPAQKPLLTIGSFVECPIAANLD